MTWTVLAPTQAWFGRCSSNFPFVSQNSLEFPRFHKAETMSYWNVSHPGHAQGSQKARRIAGLRSTVGKSKGNQSKGDSDAPRTTRNCQGKAGAFWGPAPHHAASPSAGHCTPASCGRLEISLLFTPHLRRLTMNPADWALCSAPAPNPLSCRRMTGQKTTYHGIYFYVERNDPPRAHMGSIFKAEMKSSLLNQ